MQRELSNELWNKVRPFYEDVKSELGQSHKEYIVQIVKSLKSLDFNDTEIQSIIGVYRATFKRWMGE